MRKNITMKDIAKRANVSVNTVSRALSNKQDISEETKNNIYKIAEELRYTYNSLAKDLRLNSTKTIGVLVYDNANPFFARIIKGIQDVLKNKGYQMFLCNTEENYELEVKAIKVLLEKRVDGLLIVPVEKGIDDFQELIKKNVPFVLLNRRIEGIDTDYVITNDILGGYLATNCLAKHKDRKICFLCGPLNISVARDRLEGYKRALHENGIKFKGRYVKYYNLNPEDGYKNMKQILQVEATPLSVFCASDYVAVGALKAIHEKGLKIPQDIALVGYDNIELIACLDVPITSIDPARYSLGKEGAKILIDLIENEDSERGARQIVLKPKLVIRKSSG